MVVSEKILIQLEPMKPQLSPGHEKNKSIKKKHRRLIQENLLAVWDIKFPLSISHLIFLFILTGAVTFAMCCATTSWFRCEPMHVFTDRHGDVLI